MHTKYKSCGPHGFRDLCFSHNKSNGDIDPQGVASLDPRGLCCGVLDVATYLKYLWFQRRFLKFLS